ncbi:MAG: hypothetical protein AB7U41_03955 [Dongiaceae bacterium]
MTPAVPAKPKRVLYIGDTPSIDELRGCLGMDFHLSQAKWLIDAFPLLAASEAFDIIVIDGNCRIGFWDTCAAKESGVSLPEFTKHLTGFFGREINVASPLWREHDAYVDAARIVRDKFPEAKILVSSRNYGIAGVFTCHDFEMIGVLRDLLVDPSTIRQGAHGHVIERGPRDRGGR